MRPPVEPREPRIRREERRHVDQAACLSPLSSRRLSCVQLWLPRRRRCGGTQRVCVCAVRCSRTARRRRTGPIRPISTRSASRAPTTLARPISYGLSTARLLERRLRSPTPLCSLPRSLLPYRARRSGRRRASCRLPPPGPRRSAPAPTEQPLASSGSLPFPPLPTCLLPLSSARRARRRRTMRSGTPSPPRRRWSAADRSPPASDAAITTARRRSKAPLPPPLPAAAM